MLTNFVKSFSLFKAVFSVDIFSVDLLGEDFVNKAFCRLTSSGATSTEDFGAVSSAVTVFVVEPLAERKMFYSVVMGLLITKEDCIMWIIYLTS